MVGLGVNKNHVVAGVVIVVDMLFLFEAAPP